MNRKMYYVMTVAGFMLAVLVCAAEEKRAEGTAVPPAKAEPGAEAVKTADVNEKTADVNEKSAEELKTRTGLLKTEMDKVSYSIGAQIGQNFKRQNIEIRVEAMMLGIKDALAGRELALTQAQMQEVMMSFHQRRMAKPDPERMKAEAAKNLAAGKEFLDANKLKEGVKVLPSGLQYKVIKEGTGKTPTINDTVKTHYRGRLIDGTEFDSSYRRNGPSQFPVARVIRGWTEALQLMKEGAKWELYVPPHLGYEAVPKGNIPPNSVLVFEVELLEVVQK